MSKFLFYISLLLLIGASFLGYFNEHRFKEITRNQESIIQEQHDTITATEKELKDFKETTATQSADQEKNQKELSATKESLAKTTDDLTQIRNGLANKERELVEIKNELSVKGARIEELETALQELSQSKDPTKFKNSSKNTSNQHKAKHTEIKTDTVQSETSPGELTSSPPGVKERKVVAVNTIWNFVVINMGSQDGMVNGTEISIKHENKIIAKATVTSVEELTSAADLIKDSLVSNVTVQVGDQIVVANTPAK